MKGPLFLYLVCGAFVFVAYFVFEVLLFRYSCRLAKVPRPGFLRSVAIVVVVLFAVSLAEGALGGLVREAYVFGGYPLWEAGFVAFFLGLPVHMAVCSALHAKMLGRPLSEGLSVWLVEKSIKLGLISIGAGLFALLILANKANG